ncbi:MAG: carboxypeptidase-like regulatory domain-containing protein, partial [Bacteroidales bacterium]|nr:carboxypeptidase-like regulatory domain-containing protein [Bacteroidales bacterium]
MKIYLIKNRLRKNYLNRFLFLFITFFLFQTQISQAQQVSLSNSRLTLRMAFTEIERQTGKSVDYNREIIDVNKTASIPRKDGSLSEIMTALLQGTGCTYVVREKHIVISKIQATAQQTRKNVTGNVTDQQGEPIIGATIVVKDNPSRGTVTDIDGNFYLTNIADDAVLHVSYV